MEVKANSEMRIHGVRRQIINTCGKGNMVMNVLSTIYFGYSVLLNPWLPAG